MVKQVLGYGLLLGLGLIVVRGVEHAYLAKSLDLETYVALIAIAFLAAGVMVGASQSRRRTGASPVAGIPDADVEVPKRDVASYPSSTPRTIVNLSGNEDPPNGHVFDEPSIVGDVDRKVEASRLNPHSAIRIPHLTLGRREIEILDGLARGRSNQEIAENLFLSLNTVKTHLKNIYRKLEVERRGQAVARAKELEILQ